MRVVVVSIGAVVLTGLIAIYQMPTLVDEIQGVAGTAAGVSALPDVSSAPPGNAAAGSSPAEASASAAKDAALPDRSDDEVASSENLDDAAYLADSVRVKQLRASLVDRSSRNRSRAAEELGEAADRASIPALKSLARRDPSSKVRLSAVEALGELDATEALEDIVSDPDVPEDTKVPAIGELDFESMTPEQLLSLVDHPHPDVWTEAIHNLSNVEDPWFISQLWAKAERWAETNSDLAAEIATLLEYFDEDVDEFNDWLDSLDGVDWDAAVKRRQQEAWADGVCYAGRLCS